MGGREQFERYLTHLRKIAEFLSHKWQPLILYTIAEFDEVGFSEIQSVLDGISAKMLSEGLDELDRRELITSTQSSSDKRRTIYHLTREGRELVTVLEAFCNWREQYRGQQPKILIVEDETMVAEVISEYLPEDYTTQHAETGEEALLAFDQDIDLIILDRNLPDTDGITLSEELQSRSNECLILAISGIDPGDDVTALEVDDYLRKPIAKSTFIERIEALLARRKLDAEEREYLEIRSKQQKLIEYQGYEAKESDSYERLETERKDLSLSAERRNLLESTYL